MFKKIEKGGMNKEPPSKYFSNTLMRDLIIAHYGVDLIFNK